MESSRPKEKRKTKEHITPRNGNRHEKDEQELDGIRKGGPGQSGYMERSNYVGNREDQSNSNGNDEIRLSSTGNQRNPLDPSWTEKASYGRDAAILRESLLYCPK
ncbi:unnamed protein product [Schistosoma margrebowiei]|uniref:Uncharacterized protein n=1 Tax=Schistosoma margrebowiei TaxID=48269 RepID=A0A183N5X3_9TREM|nr:unnamed protein product [Schistosoma margrebowiei]